MIGALLPRGRLTLVSSSNFFRICFKSLNLFTRKHCSVSTGLIHCERVSTPTTFTNVFCSLSPFHPFNSFAFFCICVFFFSFLGFCKKTNLSKGLNLSTSIFHFRSFSRLASILLPSLPPFTSSGTPLPQVPGQNEFSIDPFQLRTVSGESLIVLLYGTR